MSETLQQKTSQSSCIFDDDSIPGAFYAKGQKGKDRPSRDDTQQETGQPDPPESDPEDDSEDDSYDETEYEEIGQPDPPSQSWEDPETGWSRP